VSLELGSVLPLRIDALAAGGDGIGRHEDLAIFVPLTAPGDLARVRVHQVRERFARAHLLSIEEPGKRREPACPYFARCGGCSWLHVPEATQTEARIRILRDALQRIAKRSDLPPIESRESPRTLGYRARARVAYAAGRVGFRMRGSHEIVPIEHCAVLDEPTQLELEQLRRRPPHGRGEREIRGFDVRAEGLQVSPGAFFQANRSLWRDWATLVAQCCGSGDVLLELFAGVGFYTVQLERRFERVLAVEQALSAADLRVNTRAEVFGTSVETFLQTYAWDPMPNVVLMNPPRIGCSREVMEALSEHLPRRIVYVSCEPSTLARDLGRLPTQYRIVRIVALDALPQTHHVEAIVVLESG